MIIPPLILTLTLDKKKADYFNGLRKKYFPPERNFLDAHLTLFHALPNEPAITTSVKDICSGQKEFILKVTGPVSIGNGVAFKLESPELLLLHKMLQQKYFSSLSLQDRQKIWPHITIQNKVTATDAKNLLQELKSDFIPFNMQASGLQLWEYLNGPWRLLEEHAFQT